MKRFLLEMADVGVKRWMVISLYTLATYLAVSSFTPSCTPPKSAEEAAAETARQLKDPCSELSWATVVAGCKVRIEAECKKDDKQCPVYVECTKARKTWQECK